MFFLVVLGFMLLFYSLVYLFFFLLILLKDINFGESGVMGSDIFSYGSEEKVCLKVGMLFVFLRFDMMFFLGVFLYYVGLELNMFFFGLLFGLFGLMVNRNFFRIRIKSCLNLG